MIGNKMPLGIRESCGRAYKHLESFQVCGVFKGECISCLRLSLNNVSALRARINAYSSFPRCESLEIFQYNLGHL